MQVKKVVVSGIQPTGNLHLGNYLGVIKQWKKLQENPEYECRFGIMDLHALTSSQDREKIEKEADVTYKVLLEMGIKDECLFFQSEKDLAIATLFNFWQFCCNTSIGQLNRMTQFKEKSEKNNENAGLFIYPILMAADILTLKADLVPVGEDQKQHLELARDLAKKLGLKVPEPMIMITGGRIMSLVDPTKKMSKSDPNDNSRINLNDDAETIRKKIKKAATTLEGIINLKNIFTCCDGGATDKLDFSNAVKAKQMIAEQIIKELKITN